MHAEPLESSSALPYPTPEGWLSDDQYFPTPLIWAVGGLAAAVGAVSLWCTLADALVWGVVCAILFGVLAVVALTFGLFAVQFRPPQLINAVTLGRAIVRPVDDWVHFCGERPVRMWVRTWMMLSGLGTGTLLAVALPAVLGAPGGPWWLILFIPIFIACVGIVLVAVLQAVLDAKNSSFGRIPVGVLLGRDGISRTLVAGGITHVPWDQITAVDVLPRSTISICSDQGEPLEISTGVFEQRSTLMYNAVRFYFEHPELRHEVGTTVAQQRFEGWADTLSA